MITDLSYLSAFVITDLSYLSAVLITDLLYLSAVVKTYLSNRSDVVINNISYLSSVNTTCSVNWLSVTFYGEVEMVYAHERADACAFREEQPAVWTRNISTVDGNPCGVKVSE